VPILGPDIIDPRQAPLLRQRAVEAATKKMQTAEAAEAAPAKD
jgi:hypothetical protein